MLRSSLKSLDRSWKKRCLNFSKWKPLHQFYQQFLDLYCLGKTNTCCMSLQLSHKQQA